MGKRPVLVMGLVVAAIVAVHYGWSVRIGLFLDDHAHYQQLREGDWSYASAVNAARLGIVGQVMDVWARQETGLRFYRPIAFWIMRAEYALVGWRPAGMHVFCLVWHWICAMLVGWLAYRILGRWVWATVAAGEMAIHPGHVATVHWIACQTELLVTAFLLVGTLCYARYAGWWSGGSVAGGPVESETPQLSWQRRYAWLAPALAAFALALGCREHAIMWPAALVTGDWAFRSSWRRHLVAYGAMAAVAAAYLAARHVALGGFPVPGRPYLFPPSDPGFVRFIIDKFVYYMIGLFAYCPVVPVGGTEYYAAHPLSFYGTFAAVVIGLVLIFGTSPLRRRLVFALAWTVVFQIPLLPVFASMHHLYLPGAAMAWLLAAGLYTLAGDGPGPRRAVAVVLVAIHVVHMSFMTLTFGWFCRGGAQVEDLVVQDVRTTGRPLRDGDHLFFINVPMLAYYAVPAIENETGLQGLRGHVLTFSPWMLRMERPGTLERLDDRTLVVTAPAGSAYFAGAAGRTLLTVMGFPGPFKTGDRIAGSLFDAVILDADRDGVRRIRFEFHKSLDSADYHFYFGSPHRWAYPPF